MNPTSNLWMIKTQIVYDGIVSNKMEKAEGDLPACESAKDTEHHFIFLVTGNISLGKSGTRGKSN